MGATAQGMSYTWTAGFAGETPRASLESFFFFQAEDGIRDRNVTGVQTCALPICDPPVRRGAAADGRVAAEVQADLERAAAEPGPGPPAGRGQGGHPPERGPAVPGDRKSVV